MNSLAITKFNSDRQNEFNSWCFQMFVLLEIDAWQTKCTLKGYVLLTAVSSLPRPTLPFNVLAFTFKNSHLNTPGHSFKVPFINALPASHLWPLRISHSPQPLSISLIYYHFFSHLSFPPRPHPRFHQHQMYGFIRYDILFTNKLTKSSSKKLRTTPSPCCALTTMPLKWHWTWYIFVFLSSPPDRVLPQGGNKRLQ